MDKVFVREYRPNDYNGVLEIFHETIGDNIKFEPAWTISSYVWCIPYLKISPMTCFVLDDGSGKVVGYILGTASTRDFVDEFRATFLPSLDRNLMPDPGRTQEDLALDWEGDVTGSLLRLVYNPEKAMLYSANPSMVAEHQAHLHIDILPPYQGHGFGGEMVAAFLERAKALGATGCFIIPPASNTGAVRFYKRHGFRTFDEVMDGGLSGKPGHLRDGSVCLVNKF